MSDIEIKKLASINENLRHEFPYPETMERLNRKPIFDIATHRKRTADEQQKIDLSDVECQAEDQECRGRQSDESIESFRGIIYGGFISAIFWLWIFALIKFIQ